MSQVQITWEAKSLVVSYFYFFFKLKNSVKTIKLTSENLKLSFDLSNKRNLNT